MPFQLPSLPSFQPNIPQAPSPIEQYGKLLQLKMLQGQQAMQPLQMQGEQEQLKQQQIQTQQMQLEQESQQAMMKAWSDPEFTKAFTGTDAANSSGLGFDPDAMTKGLIQKGVLPKDALAMTNQFVERSQKIAATVKDQAQTTEAQAGTREKGYKVLADQIGGVLDAPTSKAGDMLTALKQDLVNNPAKYTGVPKEDLAHVFNADLEHLPAMATLIGLDGKIADFHKSKADAAASEQKIIDPGSGMSPEQKSIIKKDVVTAQLEQPLKIQQAQAEAQARQQAMQGDPNDAGKLLANGSLTLSDLKTRGSTPKFIEQATMAAQKISPTYNPADEVIAEQVAKSQPANQFFGSANSLIGKGGTLDQLEELGKNIPQGKFPALNTVDDWQKLARGKGPLAGYAATVLGVADDYSKVMGGGAGSDSARDAALHLFAQAASPEQRASAIAATRAAVQSQRDARIGNNQFLKRQYGTEVGGNNSTTTPKVPQGATHTAMGSDGKRHYTNAQGQDLGVAQ